MVGEPGLSVTVEEVPCAHELLPLKSIPTPQRLKDETFELDGNERVISNRLTPKFPELLM